MPTYVSLIFMAGLLMSNGNQHLRADEIREGKIHVIPFEHRVHYTWNKDLAPLLHINSGDIIIAETHDASDGMQHRHSTLADMDKRPPGHALTGPFYIREAEPGDVLEIRMLKIVPGDWAYTVVRPGGGGNPDITQKQGLKLWDLHGHYAEFAPGIVIGLKPFLGVLGVAWDEDGEFVTGPPREYGGNLDNKYLTEGSTLYLPVQVPGALFSFGDGHGAQGDGEVGGSAIEAPLKVTLQVMVRKDKKISGPEYETSEFYGLTGLGETVDEALRNCIHNVVEYLKREYGLSTEDAYMLSSVAVDFTILEVVDKPNMLVGGHIPKHIFGPK